jgi:hypothetical protein
MKEEGKIKLNLITEVILKAPKRLKLNDDDWQLVKLMLANMFQKTEQLVRKECKKEEHKETLACVCGREHFLVLRGNNIVYFEIRGEGNDE